MAIHKEVEHGHIHEITRPTNKIALTLIIITIVEIGVGLAVGPGLDDQLAMKQFVYVMLIGLAIIKAYFVVAYFMGLIYEEHRVALALLIIAIPLAFVFYFILMPLIGIPSFSN